MRHLPKPRIVTMFALLSFYHIIISRPREYSECIRPISIGPLPSKNPHFCRFKVFRFCVIFLISVLLYDIIESRIFWRKNFWRPRYLPRPNPWPLLRFNTFALSLCYLSQSFHQFDIISYFIKFNILLR